MFKSIVYWLLHLLAVAIVFVGFKTTLHMGAIGGILTGICAVVPIVLARAFMRS